MKYHKRVITFDPTTQNFKIEVPELGISILADTEMSAILEARKEVTVAAKKAKEVKPEWTLPNTFGVHDFNPITVDDLRREFAIPPLWVEYTNGLWQNALLRQKSGIS